jgi:glucosamine--fructose-6-phosphate aminotransferase (isomerizing)
VGGGDVAAVDRVGAWVAAALGETLATGDAVQALLGTDRVVTTGRGYSFPTACEAALKLAETSYLSAQAFSGAELLHGPIAMLDAGEPVIAVAPQGVAGRVMAPVLDTLREIGVALVTVGPPGAEPASVVNLPLPVGMPEELSPIVEIVPLQLVALQLAVAHGHDPDRPRRLRKVTATL